MGPETFVSPVSRTFFTFGIAAASSVLADMVVYFCAHMFFSHVSLNTMKYLLVGGIVFVVVAWIIMQSCKLVIQRKIVIEE